MFVFLCVWDQSYVWHSAQLFKVFMCACSLQHTISFAIVCIEYQLHIYFFICWCIYVLSVSSFCSKLLHAMTFTLLYTYCAYNVFVCLSICLNVFVSVCLSASMHLHSFVSLQSVLFGHLFVFVPKMRNKSLCVCVCLVRVYVGLHASLIHYVVAICYWILRYQLFFG